jgi:hypothetical protein
MNIDEMAYSGYLYATNKGGIPEFISEIDLLAFNAGISNANSRHGLNIPPIWAIETIKIISKAETASDKELATVWGQM